MRTVVGRITDRGYSPSREATDAEIDQLIDMLLEQKAPGCKTDVEFFRGRGSLEDQIGKQVWRQWQKENEARGFKPADDSVYIGQLARCINDPQAYVGPTQGRTYVRQLLKDRGWGSSDMGIKARDSEPSEPVALAPDLVDGAIQQLVQENPNKRKKKRRELQEEVIHRHGMRKGRTKPTNIFAST